MKLLADENVDAVIVTALRNAGHQVRYVLELDPGIDDRSVQCLLSQMPMRRWYSHQTKISASWFFGNSSSMLA